MMIELFTRPNHRLRAGPFADLRQEGPRLLAREADGSHPRVVAEQLSDGTWRINAWVHLPAAAADIGRLWERLEVID
jgi:hypothetical protein